MSKGSARRPQLVSDQQVTDNWDLAFKKYRCGYCGTCCDKDGNPITPENYDGYDTAEQVQGECCRQQEQEQQRYVTHEMAMDAQDPSLEGQPY